MAKILLVEDDNNLREIYEARLQAEGYEIVSAPDGEAALVVAKKELPDVVISDVMMPRISGFEMLDIMRNTEGLKHVKVVMLTALGQAEDQARAGKLGADKYLVKSQVTLEDIVKAASELLGEEPPAAAAPAAETETAGSTPEAPNTAPAAAEPAASPAPTPSMPVAEAPAASPAPAPAPMPVAKPPEPAATSDASTPPAPAAQGPGADVTSPAPEQPQAAPTASPTPAPAAPEAPTQAAPQQTPTPPADTATQQPTTAAPQQPAAPANDGQIVADAVKDLMNGTPGSQASSPAPAPANPPTPEAAGTPPTEPSPPAEPAQTTANDADEDTRTKRVIQPLAGDNTSLSANINDLMAKEGHEMDPAPQMPHNSALPHQPGHIIAPNPANGPEDPNKISL